MVITVQCPSCSTSFPVDPKKVPEGGVHARCSECAGVFFVAEPDPASMVEAAQSAEPVTGGVGLEEPVGTAPEDAWATDSEVGVAEPDPALGATAAEGAQQAEDLLEEPTEIRDTPETEEVVVGDGFDVSETFDEPEPIVPTTVADEVVAESDAVEAAEPEIAPETETFETPSPPVVEATPEVPAAAEAESEPATSAPSTFTFGKRDPHEKARRLARVLVSDMIMYNPERHTRAIEAGSLREDFDDEIKKSWQEYVDQVGNEIADSTSYFDDALNEILAKGDSVFP